MTLPGSVDIEWTTRRNLTECMRLIAEDRLDVENLITHRLSLSEAAAGYDALIDDPDSALGVVFEP